MIRLDKSKCLHTSYIHKKTMYIFFDNDKSVACEISHAQILSEQHLSDQLINHWSVVMERGIEVLFALFTPLSVIVVCMYVCGTRIANKQMIFLLERRIHLL